MESNEEEKPKSIYEIVMREREKFESLPDGPRRTEYANRLMTALNEYDLREKNNEDTMENKIIRADLAVLRTGVGSYLSAVEAREKKETNELRAKQAQTDAKTPAKKK